MKKKREILVVFSRRRRSHMNSRNVYTNKTTKQTFFHKQKYLIYSNIIIPFYFRFFVLRKLNNKSTLMNQILKEVTCIKCNKLFDKPVVLPCGHSTCQSHTREDDDKVVCIQCGRTHNRSEFILNVPLMNLITAQIASIDFGSEHREAKKQCEQLEDELARQESMLNDVNYLIHEKINELRNRVHVKQEELKLAIDQSVEKLLGELSEYENECKKNTKEKRFEEQLNDLKEFNTTTKSFHQSCESILNGLKYDEDMIVSVKKTIDVHLSAMRDRFGKLENELMFNQKLEQNASKVHQFEKVDFETALFHS